MKKTKPFYKSKEWKACREVVLIRDNYLCQLCLQQGQLTAADVVHHIEHLQDNPDRALDPDNLQSVCASCHNRLHPEKAGGKPKPTPKGVRIIKTIPNNSI